MSKKTRDRKQQAREQDPLAQRARVAGLAVLVALQWCCIIGARGPWWQSMYRGEPFGDPTMGAGDPWGALIIVASLAGFFFASYDLLAGEDIHLPILIASLAAGLGTGQVFHRVWVSESTMESIAEDVAKARVLAPAPMPAEPAPIVSAPPGAHDQTIVGPPVVLEGEDVAAVEGEADGLLGGIGLRFRWGLALILTASPLMIVVSAAMTLLARRAPESVP